MFDQWLSLDGLRNKEKKASGTDNGRKAVVDMHNRIGQVVSAPTWQWLAIGMFWLQSNM